MAGDESRPVTRVPVGRISGVFGVRGWVKVFSYTDPREQIVSYSPWMLRTGDGTQVRRVVDGGAHGGGVVAALEGVTDRDAASALVGAEIEVDRALLPETAEGEFYWADLEGMEVRNLAGVRLGVVDHLIATGSNDVLVVTGERRHLIPFLYGQAIRNVDLAGRVITADWEEDY